MIRVLITGFGPFPGVRDNPTAALARKLAAARGFAGVKRSAHVFHTSYAAVDRELPRLLRRYRPDVLLMFGVAARRKRISIETLARNAIGTTADAAGSVPRSRSIAPRAKDRAMPAPARELARAARKAGVPASVSKDAGGYLCNYLCWHAAGAAAQRSGPKLAAFVHVPPLRTALPGGKSLKAADLARAGAAILEVLVTAAKAR